MRVEHEVETRPTLCRFSLISSANDSTVAKESSVASDVTVSDAFAIPEQSPVSVPRPFWLRLRLPSRNTQQPPQTRRRVRGGALPDPGADETLLHPRESPRPGPSPSSTRSTI